MEFCQDSETRSSFQIGPQGQVVFQTPSVLRMLVHWGKRVLKLTSAQQGTMATQQNSRGEDASAVLGCRKPLLRGWGPLHPGKGVSICTISYVLITVVVVLDGGRTLFLVHCKWKTGAG